MDTLFNSINPITSRVSSFSRKGEPVSVNSIESIKTFPTEPNMRYVFFHAKEPIFYRVVTDGNNYPDITTFRYHEELAPQAPQYVTIEDLNKFKEDLLNEWQHIRNESTTTSSITNTESITNTTSATNGECVKSQPNPTTNVADVSKSESPIW